MWMWFSFNAVATTPPIGLLANGVFGLSFGHSIATIMCFAALGCTCTAFIATLGPKVGRSRDEEKKSGH
jgi:purine-cytosine permease-like protein